MTTGSPAPRAARPGDLPWLDAAPFEAQRERTRHALAAIVATLQERRPLDGQEAVFLEQHAAVQDADATRLAAVWSCPAAHAWTWRTFACLKARLEDPGSKDATQHLRSQLDAFALFALAVGAGFRPSTSAPVPGLPGEGLNLPGTRLVQEQGRLVERPVVRVSGAEIALLPEALCVPGADWPDAALSRDVGVAFHEAHAGTLCQALSLIERFQPATFARVRDHMQVIALLPEQARRYPNASSSEHPGAMLLGAYPDAHELADHLIHEHHHNHLFAIEGAHALLDVTSGLMEAYYSPWRDEPRSLRGLLHGVYVFVPVHDFWRAVQQEESASPVAQAAADHADRAALQLHLAVDVLERHARLTAAGTALFAAVRDRVRATCAAPDATPALRAAVHEHRERFDHQGHTRTAGRAADA